MKKLFMNQKFIQKTIISIIIVLLFSFAVPVKSQAGPGGTLLNPVFDLLGTICDAVVGGLQMFLVDGKFNNSDDGGILNPFLIEIDAFKENTNGQYNEFQYSNPNDSDDNIADETIYESELETTTYYIPALKYTPEKIFSGQIPALDINFVKPTDWGDQEMNDRSVAYQLHGTIASWYVALRNLSIVGLMLVLVYVGIRIVISTTASDKSKYKQMLMDWLIALCLLFCMHYIMTFTTTIVKEISQAILGTDSNNNGNSVAVRVIADSVGDTNSQVESETESESTSEDTSESEEETSLQVESETETESESTSEDTSESEEETNSQVAPGSEIVSFNTDLMGLIRFKMQSPTVWYKLLYLIFYIAMVIYTVLFTFTYLKRVLIMAFLTLISPLVALTYPIDKLRDGKAQAFDMWFKEYVFNALLQPFHLIIYSIFVGAAIDLASKNPIFAIVALAFLTPAEKLLRKFFGFEKSSTSGALGTAASIAGGAAAFNMVNKALSHRGGGKTSSKGKNDVRTVKSPEADIPSWSEATGKPTESITDNSEENDKNTRIKYSEQSSGQNQQIGNNGGQNEIPSALYDHRAQMQTASGIILPAGDIRNTKTESKTKEKSWTENDTRGVGKWATDVAKEKLSNSKIGQRYSARKGRAAQKAEERAKKRAEKIEERTEKRAEAMKKIPKPIRNTVTTLGSGVKDFGKGVANVAKETGKAAGKGALHLAGRTAAAIPGAAFGMAAGIAGDELGDILKYTAAGGALSGATLPDIASSAGSFVSSAYKQGTYGSDDALIAQVERNFVKSKENDAVINHEFKHDGVDLSNAELKARKQQIAHYIGQGFDVDSSIKATKTEDKIKKELQSQKEVPENADELAQAQASRIMKVAKDYSAKDLRDKEKLKGLRDQITESLVKGNFGRKEAENQAKRYVQYIKEAKGVK